MPSTPPSSSRSHFRAVAPAYHRLRPLTSGDRRRVAMLLDRCPVPEGAAVAEVGCGPGKLLGEVVRRARPAVAIGVDAEPAMLAGATGFEARLGRAEDLPIADGSLDLVFCSLVFHLLEDRARAAAELRRVLRPGGWAAIWTLTPEHVLGYHLNPYFPSLVAVDLPRLQAPERWMRVLVEAGFPCVAEQELRLTRTSTAAALARLVRDRFISTMSLLPETEFEEGARRLEAEAAADPDRTITHTQVWCLLWARR